MMNRKTFYKKTFLILMFLTVIFFLSFSEAQCASEEEFSQNKNNGIHLFFISIGISIGFGLGLGSFFKSVFTDHFHSPTPTEIPDKRVRPKVTLMYPYQPIFKPKVFSWPVSSTFYTKTYWKIEEAKLEKKINDDWLILKKKCEGTFRSFPELREKLRKEHREKFNHELTVLQTRKRLFLRRFGKVKTK